MVRVRVKVRVRIRVGAGIRFRVSAPSPPPSGQNWMGCPEWRTLYAATEMGLRELGLHWLGAGLG